MAFGWTLYDVLRHKKINRERDVNHGSKKVVRFVVALRRSAIANRLWRRSSLDCTPTMTSLLLDPNLLQPLLPTFPPDETDAKESERGHHASSAAVAALLVQHHSSALLVGSDPNQFATTPPATTVTTALLLAPAPTATAAAVLLAAAPTASSAVGAAEMGATAALAAAVGAPTSSANHFVRKAFDIFSNPRFEVDRVRQCQADWRLDSHVIEPPPPP